MKSNDARKVLIWAGLIVFALGAFVGLKPVMINETYNCGSAWFPGSCVPGMLDSAVTISTVLLLLGGASAIAGMVVGSQKDLSGR